MAPAMSKDVIKNCLKAVPLFANLSVEELTVLASVARTAIVRRRARIFEEGDTADCCFVLTSGKARVVLNGDNGTEILLHIVTPTRLVGEVALLDRSTRSASLVASQACQLIRIPAAALDALRSNPGFEAHLVAGLVSRLREADDHVRVVSTLSSLRRVAWCLGRIARYEGHRDGPNVVIPKMGHADLAEMAGCSRETVSRALGTLKRKKYVTWDRRTIRLDVDNIQRYFGTELTVPGPRDPASSPAS